MEDSSEICKLTRAVNDGGGQNSWTTINTILKQWQTKKLSSGGYQKQKRHNRLKS